MDRLGAAVGRRLRVIVSLGLAAGLVLVFSTALVEDIVHEWVGVACLALAVVHIMLNWRRVKTLARQGRRPHNAIALVVDALLALCVLALMASSLVLSAHVFVWLPALPGARLARTFHMTCSHWLFCLSFMQAGLHLREMTTGVFRSRAIRAFAGAALFALGIGGIWNFVALDFAAYLVLAREFSFVDVAKPLVLRIAEWMSVAALFVLIGAGMGALTSYGRRKGAERRGR